MAPVNLDSKSLDQLERLVATEVDHRLAWTHPEDYAAQVKGVVDTVLNRVASGKWGDSIASVANAKNQFSAINGPKNKKYTVYGSVDSVPDSVVPPYMRNIVSSWVQERAMGAPDSVNGGLNYANPGYSDKKNLGWINALDGPKLGYGDSTHFHGTVKGLTPVRSTVRLGPEGAPYPSQKPAIVKAQQSARSADYSYLPMQPLGGSPSPRGISAGGYALGKSVPADMSVTPNINGTSNQPIPSSAYTDARRSLFGNQPIAETGLANDTMNRGGSFAPYTLPNMPPWMVSKPNPVPYSPTMPVGGPGTFGGGAMPGADPAVPLPRPRPATPTSVAETAPVPMPRNARPASQPAAKPAAAKQMTTINGKPFEVGSLHKVAGDVVKVVIGPDGKGKTQKIDAGLIDQAGDNSIVGGLVDKGWQSAVQTAKADAAQVGGAVVADVGAKAKELTNQAGSFLTNLFGGGNKPASQPATVQPAPRTATPTFQQGMLGRASAAPAAVAPKTPVNPLTGFGGMTGTAPRPAAAPVSVTQAAPVTQYRQIVNPAYLDYMNAQKANVMAGAGMLGSAKNVPYSPFMPTGGPGTFPVAPNTAKAPPPPQYIQQAYTVPVVQPKIAPQPIVQAVGMPTQLPMPSAGGYSLNPTLSMFGQQGFQHNGSSLLPAAYTSGGYRFDKTGTQIGRDYRYRAEPGSRGTAAGSDNNSKFETTAIQRANYDRQGISY